MADLYASDAHFVLCRGKRPIWPGWRRRRPALDVVHLHGPEIGLIPHSIKTSALDIDEVIGDGLGELIDHHQPLVTLDTPRGFHAYYRDSIPRGNGKWSAYGCSGDIRSAKGFLRLYDGGAQRLAGALKTTDLDHCRFPADLFAAAGLPPMTRVRTKAPKTWRCKTPADIVRPEDAREGNRHICVFDRLRFWAYSADKGDCLDAWTKRVCNEALKIHQRIPVIAGQRDYSQKEALMTAWAVASWTWSGGGPFDHSPAAQRRRILKRWHGHGTTKGEAAIADRTAAIWRLHDEGRGQVSIGDAVGCSTSTVCRTLARARPPDVPQRGLFGG
ncbi:MAG: hypothetical protein OXD30_00160 [Bryobacterales bacterium]|nr:hypothetical protein [Bryobacterales bacterium]